MRTLFCSGLVVCGTLLALSGCKPRVDNGSATLNYGTSEVEKKKPLTLAEKHDLYYLSEGAELIPYFLVKAINVTIRVPNPEMGGETKEITVPYLDPRNLKRFGFLEGQSDEIAQKSGVRLQEPLNPENLPVGISLSVSPDTQLLSLGVNCASCHVGELKYQSKTNGNNWKSLRIDGGANMVDIFGFYGGIFDGLAKGFGMGQEETVPAKTSKVAKTWSESFTNAYNKTKEFGSSAVGTAASIASSANFLKRASYHAASLSYTYRNWESKSDPQNWKSLLLERMDISRRAFSFMVRPKRSGDPSDEVFVKTLNVDELRRRLLLSRLRYTKALYAAKSKAGPIFGLADSVGVAHILLGGKAKVPPPPSPISIPHLFNIETVDWFHFTGNTNSIIDRNLVQAVGLGATTDVVDVNGKQTYTTTARLENLDRMESIYYKLAPPAFPADGDRDISEATQAAGKKVYLAECARCHQPEKTAEGIYRSNAFTVAEIGTDPTPFKVVDSKYPDENGDYLPILIGNVAEKVKKRYIELNKTPQAKIDEWQNRKIRPESVWRYLGAADSDKKILIARPLDGVWATAPFLHNGAVPNLADLLKPAAERTKVFYLGHRFYDMKKVGYTVEVTKNESINAIGRIDTSIPGFFNIGHEHGIGLAPEEKTALLEFLKGFGAGESRPTIFPLN